MNTLTEVAEAAAHVNGQIVARMQSGAEIRFAVADNPRLACGTHEQLNRIEVSPFGLHWPELDEDLSYRGLTDGDHGQRQERAETEQPASGSYQAQDGVSGVALKEAPPSQRPDRHE